MRPAARALFFAAARTAPPDPAAVRTILESAARGAPGEDGPWEDAAAIARRVGQEPLFLQLITERVPGAPVSAATLADLRNQARYHAFRWAEIRDALAAALEALAPGGIRPLFLKGLAAVGEYYDPPALRPMKDLDILVAPSDIGRAEELLLQGGFHRGEPDPSAPDWEDHHHLPPLFHRGTGVCLEVHHQAARPSGSLRGFPGPEEILSFRRPSLLFPELADAPDPTGLVLISCAHITHGDSIGRRAQNLIDLVRVLDASGPAVDWDRLVGLAAAPDVARALAVPLEYLAREGLPSAPAEAARRLRRLSGLRDGELSLLHSLTDRYRIGCPPPWRWVSGRISNIVWRHLVRRESRALRWPSIALEAAFRR